MDEPPPTAELDELFARLAGGDRAAIGQAFTRVYPMVRRFCERLLNDVCDAEDATQQALERVFERIATYDTSRPALPWVLGIAAWEVRTVRRKRWRSQKRAAKFEAHEVAAGAPSPEAGAASRQLLSAVDDLIATLPTRERETMQQVIQQELALVLENKGDSTFRKRKERALDRLRALLRNLGHVQ